MLKFCSTFLFMVVSVFVFAQDTAMSSTEILGFKKQVIETSKISKTIQSDFVQYKHLDFLDNDIKTIGKLQFKAPGLVLWQYTKPYQYSVIFKEDKLLINDGGTKSNVDIGSSKMFKKLNNLIINSVKGDLFNDDDFEVTFLKTKGANKTILISKDKNIADYIASFELLFDTKTGAVTQVKMIEPSQDFTRIVFSNRIINVPINDSVFNQ